MPHGPISRPHRYGPDPQRGRSPRRQGKFGAASTVLDSHSEFQDAKKIRLAGEAIAVHPKPHRDAGADELAEQRKSPTAAHLSMRQDAHGRAGILDHLNFRRTGRAAVHDIHVGAKQVLLGMTLDVSGRLRLNGADMDSDRQA